MRKSSWPVDNARWKKMMSLFANLMSMVIECSLVLQDPAMFQISSQAPTTAAPATRAAVMDPLLYVAAAVMQLDAMVMD